MQTLNWSTRPGGRNGRRALRAIAAVALLTGGCTSDFTVPEERVDYRRADVSRALEIPPDLTTSSIDDALVVPEMRPAGTATFSDYTRERGQVGAQAGSEVLPQPSQSVRVVRDGQRRWLVVQDTPEEVWQMTRRFWRENGFVLKREDPATGIMETDWAENRADIPGGPVRGLITRVKIFEDIYSAPTRDRFRTRVERGIEPGTTEIYITHYGVAEVAVGRDTESFRWEPRPEDPELEAEMLQRLMLYMGVAEERTYALLESKGAPGNRTRMDRGAGGESELIIYESFGKAWNLVGLSLDVNGFNVEDQSRDRGIYMVRSLEAEEDGGLMDTLTFWADDDEGVLYVVRVDSVDLTTSRVRILDDDGDHADGAIPRDILRALEQDLR